MKRLMSLVIAGILALVPAFLGAQENLPKSREAVFIEMNGPGEVLVKAKGIGGVSGMFGFKEEESLKIALEDAKKAAVYLVVYGGAGLDPVIKTPEEKNKFASFENDFFWSENLRKYIVWEAQSLDSRVKLAGGDKIKVEKQFRISRQAIITDLTERGILQGTKELAEEIGLPTMMALPDVKPGQNPLEQLRTDAVLKQGASVIESYLTARKYDVIAPDQAEQIFQQHRAQLALKGQEEDLSYAIALSVGSDVYITYTISIENRMVGSTQVHKASVSVRAYETTTARLLGTETGYSEESAAPATALVEAAITNALNNVMSRINGYWTDDVKIGLQYKVIFNLTGKFDEDTRYDIADAVSKTLKKICNRTKENVVSEKTIDYLVWVSNKDMQSPTSFFRETRREFLANFSKGKLRQINLNRKLMILGIE
ncbi:MAG: DUF6175 family protein [Ignavibacteriales bacterium]|nr:DUF6175 family protein [Ignavibacteriales bacterium]